jgi:hypothetical protein
MVKVSIVTVTVIYISLSITPSLCHISNIRINMLMPVQHDSYTLLRVLVVLTDCGILALSNKRR